MMKLLIRTRTLWCCVVLALAVGVYAVPCAATSGRLVGEAGYAAQDFTMEDTGRNYSGGMDIVYGQVATGTAAAKTRCFLKAEDTLDWDTYLGTLKVMLYDNQGGLVQQVALVDPGEMVYSGTVKLNPDGDTIWFSDTKNASTSGSFYTVTANLDTLTFGTPVEQFVLPGAWELEWPAAGPRAGTPFFVGKQSDAWTDPHAIFVRTGGAWQKVVEVGGYSNGIAFDNAGNLWCGSYTSSGPSDQQYAYMFKAAQVDNAITTSTTLYPADANQTIELLTFMDGNDTYYTAPNDFECDPQGNVYITLNGGFDEVNNTEAGYVVVLPNDGTTLPPGGYSQGDLVKLAKTDPTSDWDWQKALAYDGTTNLDAGGVTDPTIPGITGNRLFVDQDYSWGAGGPDQVTSVTIDDDTDGDGVPDAVDNAYLTYTENADQRDTDHDMYGNIADADLNNDGSVDAIDRATFRTTFDLGSGDPGFNENADFNGDGAVDALDRTTLRQRFTTSAPYF